MPRSAEVVLFSEPATEPPEHSASVGRAEVESVTPDAIGVMVVKGGRRFFVPWSNVRHVRF
jgi:hypothetical protein